MAAVSVGLAGLNESQRQAVRQIEGPVLILAGAGSGKTRVITTRIAYLLANDVPPEQVLAVTFTNKAANEMRERVGGMVAKKLASKLTISTFHALCVRILRSGIEKLGYKSTFTIYTGSDQLGLLRQIIVRKAAKDEKLDAGMVLSLISRWKNKGVPVSDSPDTLIAEVAREYQYQLKRHNAVDFDDLLLLAGNLLEKHPDVREAWQQRYRYLMVDEFQDTNRQQMQLLRHLAGSRPNVCVVGDDDQSIYGWRGAEIANILDFERFFPNPVIIKLQENYRSQAPILATANAVIRNNRGRREKELIATKKGDCPLRLVAMPGDAEEAEFVINEIWEANALKRKPFEDFAILFRTNAQSRLFEEALRKRGIPYRLLGGQSFYERREVKDVLAYLRVIANPADDVNFLRIVNLPPRGLSDTTVELATEASIQRKVPVSTMLADPEFQHPFSTKTRNALDRFGQQLRAWHEAFTRPGANYAAMTEALLKEIGYHDYLKRSCGTPEETLMREGNVHEFVQSIYQHHAKRGASGLRHFLDTVTLDDDFKGEDDKEKAAKKPGVWLITLHAAKGLEFPDVYLVGLEQGVLPHKRSLEEGTLDEERRLLYVGITRAMEQLTITYCQWRIRYGEPVAVMPSAFMKELPTPPVEKLSYKELASRPASLETAKGHFANIRALIAAKGGQGGRVL